MSFNHIPLKFNNLRNVFNPTALKTRATSLLIEHSPCCILTLLASTAGVSAFSHNPTLELGFAVGGAVIGEHIGHKYFAKNCNHSEEKNVSAIIKRYGIALSFGLATWAGHQTFFHNHNENDHQLSECIDGNQHHLDLSNIKGADYGNHNHNHIPVCAFR